MNEAAKRLGVNPNTVWAFIEKGIIKAKQVVKYAPFEIESSEIDKDMVKRVMKRIEVVSC